MKDDKVKSDLHVHIDTNVSKNDLINILKNAERNGVKYLSILEHYATRLYRDDGILQHLIDTGEIEQYFTGTLISGVEMTCTIDKGVASDSFDYSDYAVHITVLNFNTEEAEEAGAVDKSGVMRRWLHPDFMEEAMKENERRIRAMLKEIGLPEPPDDYFTYDGKRDSIEKQLYNYIYVENENTELPEIYNSVIGTSKNISDFVRTKFESPTGPLFYQNCYYPTISSCIPELKKAGKNVIVAISHPAYMNGSFDYDDYIKTMLLAYGDLFDTIEVQYSQNSPEESKNLREFAELNNMPIVAGGTDSAITKSGKMFLMLNGEKLFYEPQLGTAIKEEILTGDGTILLSEEDMKKCGYYDIRCQSRFNMFGHNVSVHDRIYLSYLTIKESIEKAKHEKYDLSDALKAYYDGLSQ